MYVIFIKEKKIKKKKEKEKEMDANKLWPTQLIWSVN